jgi:hypothetical protein
LALDIVIYCFSIFSALAFFSIVGLVLSVPAKNECPKVCTADYAPVCGKPAQGNQDKLITFGNKCVLDVFNCEKSENSML